MAKRKIKDEQPVVLSYKGFDSNWQCRGFQYEVGKTYTHDGKVEACSSGFHAYKYPLDVLLYYPAGNSRFATTEQTGKIAHHCDDSKVASSTIKITGEIGLPGLIKAAVEYTFSRAKANGLIENNVEKQIASNSGDYGAASNSGRRGAASNSGDYGAASNSGRRGAASNSGICGAASNSGYCGAASNSGRRGAASNSGDYGAASNSGYCGAASNSGRRGAASNSGDYGAASNSGPHGVAMSSGYDGKVSGSDGSALFLVERNSDYEIVSVWAGISGKGGIKVDTFYKLIGGKPVEV